MPKISIIVPIYNVEKYLDRCMQSLLNQTLTDIEIIMVDDGSPDRCPQMCDEYAKKDSRIKVIHKSNAGLGYARNSGLEIATGEYVAFVDSDDYVDTQMYESLYVSAKKENTDAAFCGFYTEIRKGKWVESNEVSENKVWENGDVRSFMLDMIASAPYEKQERKYQMSVWHSIYKNKIIKDNNITFCSERNVGSEDIPFQIDFMNLSKTIVYLKNSFYRYCFNETSLTKTFSLERYNRYKTLRICLMSKQQDEIFIQRVERLFIGYSRSFIDCIANSKTEDKKKILKNIANDSVWNDVQKSYKTSWLPLYSRIYYCLILNKNINLIILYSKVLNLIKSVRHYK